MKNLAAVLIAVLIGCTARAQWENKEINTVDGDLYRFSYTENAICGAVLRMEKINGGIELYLSGDFWCELNPIVDFSFLINKQYVKYSEICSVRGEFNNILSVTSDLETTNMFLDFKKCTQLKIRVIQTDCKNAYYTFNMIGINSAFRFLKHNE
jgi:hypothetical protein